MIKKKKRKLKKLVHKKPLVKVKVKKERKKKLSYTRIDMSTMLPLEGFHQVYTFRKIPK